jgi:hypothetical protein
LIVYANVLVTPTPLKPTFTLCADCLMTGVPPDVFAVTIVAAIAGFPVVLTDAVALTAPAAGTVFHQSPSPTLSVGKLEIFVHEASGFEEVEIFPSCQPIASSAKSFACVETPDAVIVCEVPADCAVTVPMAASNASVPVMPGGPANTKFCGSSSNIKDKIPALVTGLPGTGVENNTLGADSPTLVTPPLELVAGVAAICMMA